jgi:hypothetical protein
MKPITKGSVLFVRGWWYVFVKRINDYYCCICDNANNIYSFPEDQIEFSATAHDAIKAQNWGFCDDDSLMDHIRERTVPIDVIAEVLAGCHDNRFDHWAK